MKTIITFLALATALFGQSASDYMTLTRAMTVEETRSLAQSTTTNEVKSPAIEWGNPLFTSDKKVDVPITVKYDIIWSADNAAGKLLSVNGITQLVPIPLTGNTNTWLTRKKAPEKPDEIVVHVWTADGKKWKAKWEEVK